MNDAELYQLSNQQQKRDSESFLNEYSTKIKWKQENIRVLDIGCGDGSVTNILKRYIPNDYTLVGSDVNEQMVKLAKTSSHDKNVSFMVLDIEGDLPTGLKESFDHVFSFYTLHWIVNQERAFTNIYELLCSEGECFMIFVASAPNFDVYRILARNSKWTPWMKEVERYVAPYNDVQEPVEPVRCMLKKIGFSDIDVQCKELEFTYDDMETARNALRSICPFKIPDDLYSDFMDDFIEAAEKMEKFYKINNDRGETLSYGYRLLVVHARKHV